MSAASPARALDEHMVELKTRPDITVRVMVTEPAGKPSAVVLLFVGGNGKAGLWKREPTPSQNFLSRSRGLFSAAGFRTLLVDVPSDRRQDGMRGFRDSAGHRDDVAAVIAWARAQSTAPLWLVGTSRGTTSVAHLGAALKVDGIVLSSSVTRPSRKNPASAMDAPLEKITAPVLIVHHREDACPVTPLSGVDDLRNRLTGSRRVEVMLFDGGSFPQSGPCQALARHGFIGIEDRVVSAIAARIKAITPAGG